METAFYAMSVSDNAALKSLDDLAFGLHLTYQSAWRSLPGYPFPVWSLLEMAAAGVATPLDEKPTGICEGADAKLVHARKCMALE